MKKFLYLSISCLSISLFAGTIFSQTLNLEYSTYLGGSGTVWGNAIAVDNTGCVYITGRESSTDFPTANPPVEKSSCQRRGRGWGAI